MFGRRKATVEVPATDNSKAFTKKLSDYKAMLYGKQQARRLSERDGFVTVTLASGSVRVIGYDTSTGKITIGRLHPNYRTHVELNG